MPAAVACLLPATLLILLFSSPIFATPTTPYNPFHEISRHVQKTPDPPICCLKPLPSSELAEEILSFEDWKAKQLSLHDDGKKWQPPPSAVGSPEASPEWSVDLAPVQQTAPDPPHPPHFRVPLTDRFNYASLDCSARVHSAHASARSPGALLSSKKDRYMLSPCSAPQQKFVVVELCEDIRIDTVQLANFEFFSGVFKDFNVSVATTYSTDPDGWTHAGTYRAKNVRGVQSFHPPTSLRDFYRYIRIDFLSHYGNEYYCPVSLLRVYGLTHMEHWKWDVWEAESRAKRGEAEDVAVPLVTGETPTSVVEAVVRIETAESTQLSEAQGQDPSPDGNTTSLVANETDVVHEVPSVNNSAPIAAVSKQESSTDPSSTTASEASELLQETSSTSELVPSTDKTSASSATGSAPLEVVRTDVVSASEEHIPSSDAPHTTHPSSSSSQEQLSAATQAQSESSPISVLPTSATSSARVTPATNTVNVPTIIPSAPSVLAVASAGESIYRTIMNRLGVLEANATLYTRYVEEQTRSVRDALRRLEEDVGRLDGIGKAQSQLFMRTLREWETQRARLERDHSELLSRVDFLADEVVLEKRLGIAQLCLLLTVLVFMALTRGSRGGALVDDTALAMGGFGRRNSLREWGRRHLSLSGDWVSRFRSRSRSPTPGRYAEATPHPEGKIQFPTSRAGGAEQQPHARRTPAQKHRTPGGVRTPVARHFPTSVHHRPATPPTPAPGRPQLRRVNSHSTPAAALGPVPRSAKRWAKSAHLHEITTPGRRPAAERGGALPWPATPPRAGAKGKGREGEPDCGAVQTPSPGRAPLAPLLNAARKLASPWRPSGEGVSPSEADAENESWVDTDVDGSEAGQDQDVELLEDLTIKH